MNIFYIGAKWNERIVHPLFGMIYSSLIYISFGTDIIETVATGNLCFPNRFIKRKRILRILYELLETGPALNLIQLDIDSRGVLFQRFAWPKEVPYVYLSLGK